jgi:aspartate/glutamate racemase
MRSIWHLFDFLPEWVRPVVLTALLGGLGWKLAATVYRLISRLIERRQDKKVFRYIKTTKSLGSLYNVEEIAEALRRTKQQVWRALERLEEQKKVKCYGNLWGLHELER